MRNAEKEHLKKKIDQAKLISFDVFDTLLFRKTNDPETVFDLVGKHFGIHGFRKLRMDEQNEASRRVYAQKKYPHADMNEIYDVLAEHTEIAVDWDEVKKFEIQMEKDALVANTEMMEIFQYAKKSGKRVVVTSDMYLLADTLREILEENGFVGFDYIYCSADEHKAKFNKELFEAVAQKEQVPYQEILHIGDKARDDGEYPASYGINTFIYNRTFDPNKVKNAPASDIDNGLYKILYNENNGFWYNLGVEVGGPLYMGLFLWMKEKVQNSGKKIFFLARDGYNLYHVFKDAGFENIEYLYTSRRALILAGITDLTEEDIRELPPYTRGQTVAEILDYLCVPTEKIDHLREAGFYSFRDVIVTDADMENFRNLYRLNREVFLERCRYERECAVSYFRKTGFLDGDSIVFDCGWSGSSQHLLDRFKKAIGFQYSNYFYYFGIKNGEKSCRQLHGKHYDAYAFDFYRNYSLQGCVNDAVVMYELFFSAPHESVYHYDLNGVVFETGEGDTEKEEMLDGIRTYLKQGLPFAEKYQIEYPPEVAIGHLQRLIQFPTEDEAVNIGNLNNVDGFARQSEAEKHIAFVTEEQFNNNPNIEIYWMKGLLKRSDVSEELKGRVAAARGVVYPEGAPAEYHLEDEQSIRNYYRWIRYQEKKIEPKTELSYRPKFSVVIPVYNTVTEQLQEAIESVLTQTYENFELILVDDHSSWDNVVPVLKSYETNRHVQVIYRETNGHISVATNDGINRATGDFVVFMDCDDMIETDALYEFAKKLNENPQLDFIYSDEDKITEDGKIRHFPFFKPEWSPDLFMSVMYTNHLAAYRLSIVREIGGLRSAYNGCQDYDMTLRFMEKSDNKRVGHISKVLYHWRERKESVAFAMTSKNYAAEATRYTKEDALKRRNIAGHMEYVNGMSQYRVVYEPKGEPLVSIVIPSKDHPDILKQCINSIIDFTDYTNYEVIVVDNGSNDKNKELIAAYLESVGATYLYHTFDFNFSKMCNIGADASSGEYILFLNDDIEIFQRDWLSRMTGQAMQKHVGAVGAKLMFPDSTIIQHSGISNIKEGPSHNYLYMNDAVPYGIGYNWLDYDCIAVTGACLMVSEKIFNQMGGFDESFPVAYNDIDLCFKIHEAGYYNVIRNDVVAYHHESLSRGTDMIDDTKRLRLSGEGKALYRKHPGLKEYDPYLNKYLHNYAPILDLNVKYDEVEPTKINKFISDVTGFIDQVNITDKIQLLGWSCLIGRTDNAELERYLLLADPYDNQYKIPVNKVARPDIVASFDGREDLLYSGFECIIDKSIIKVDVLQYRIGMQIIDTDGVSHVIWSNTVTDIDRSFQPFSRYCDMKELSDFSLSDAHKQVFWNIEDCIENANGYNLKGWVFCDENNHFKYKKELVLRPKEGKTLLFEVIDERRLDVSVAFPHIHYLYNTGFRCNIYKDDLEAGTEYEVILRMKNLFNEDDVADVVTGQKVCRNK